MVTKKVGLYLSEHNTEVHKKQLTKFSPLIFEDMAMHKLSNIKRTL